MAALYVTPQASSGGVHLRSEPEVDQSMLLGTLNEGVKLELDQQNSEWNTGKIYVSMQVAGAGGGSVTACPAWTRSTSVARPALIPAPMWATFKRIRAWN